MVFISSGVLFGIYRPTKQLKIGICKEKKKNKEHKPYLQYQLKSRKWNAIGHNESMLRFHNGGNLTLGIGIPMDFDELRKPKIELY